MKKNKKKKKKELLFCLLLLLLGLLGTAALAPPAHGETINFIESSIFFNGFDEEDFDDVSKDLGAAFAFSTNSGGSSLGKLWGIEAGLLFGVTNASNIARIVKEHSGKDQSELARIPSGGLIAGVAFPFGIGIEANIIPKLDVSDASFSNSALAVRWEITDTTPLIGGFSPLKLALRASYGNSGFDYQDNTEKANFNIKNTEIAAIAGFNLFLVEPYISLGYLKTSVDLNAKSKSLLLEIPAEINLDSSLSTTKFTTGILFKLPIIRFGFEHVNFSGGVNRYTAKLSFKI